MRLLATPSTKLIAAVALAALATVACQDRQPSRATVTHSVTGVARAFIIADPASSTGDHRRPGQCARALNDRASGERLILRGWDERKSQERRGDTTFVESYEHGFYTPLDAKAVGLAPGQEFEVDCRTFEAVGVNTPDLRSTS